jgi:exodeoxyribonuclease-3
MNLKNGKIYKLTTWNVNGLRASYSKGLKDYLLKSKPTVINLQEIKCFDHQVESIVEELATHYKAYFHSAKKAGYSGLLTLIANEYVDQAKVVNGIGEEKFDCEGRFQEVHFNDFIMLAGYYPNGQRDHSRVDYKLEFSRMALDKAKLLEKKFNKPIYLCGDFNTAHKEIDLANPKANVNTTGFLPHERKFIDQMIENNFFDLYRKHHGDVNNKYTWWTYRFNCREKNIGWRLDYFFGNQKGFESLKQIEILNEIQGSDHCPVEITCEF